MLGLFFYHIALLLYPPGFRRRFKAEMLELFRHRQAVHRPAELWWSVAGDLVRTVPSAWLGVVRPSMRSRDTPSAGDPFRHRGLGESLGLLVRDVRFAVRNLRRTPAFTALAVTTLGLGVGANTAIFSVVNGVMLKPLPYPEPQQLAMIWHTRQNGSDSRSMSLPDIRDIQSDLPSLRAAGFSQSSATITSSGQPEVVEAARVSDGLLGVFGVQPTLGRDIRAAETIDGGPRVVVVGYAFWQQRLGARTDVVGTTVELSGESYEIVGVAPPEFDFPSGAQLWYPIHLNTDDCGRGCHTLHVVSRLEGGTSFAAAQAQLSTLAARLRDEYPADNYGKYFRLERLTDTVYGQVRTGLLVLLGAVGIVLLIAAANVANLLLVRASARTGEIAVRAALGAGRGRLVCQLLIEALVLAALGGVMGLGIARAGLGFLLQRASATLPRVSEVSVDGTVLAFTLGLVTVVTFLFGLAPALRLARVPVAQALNHGARGGGSTSSARSRSLLVVIEIGMSLMLLFGAGLLLRTFAALNAVELGFDHEHVRTFDLSIPSATYQTPNDAARFVQQVEERLSALTTVERVGGAIGSPMSGHTISGAFLLLDRPTPPAGQEEISVVRIVTPGYLDALRIPVLQGRSLAPRDRYGAEPVALVSEAFVARYYPDKDPLGQQLQMEISLGYPEDDPRTIVGVVEDIRSLGVRQDARPEIYIPHAQSGAGFVTMVVRSAPGSATPLSEIRRVVLQVDPNMPLRNVETLATAVQRSFGATKFYLMLLTAFAGLAMALTAIGLYGVIAYLVSGRTQEIGIRMALGAEGRDVIRMVLAQGLRPAVLGVVVGLAGTMAGSRLLRSLLFNVTPLDATTLLTATGVLLGVVVVAILVPASRASRIAPVVALKLQQ